MERSIQLVFFSEGGDAIKLHKESSLTISTNEDKSNITTGEWYILRVAQAALPRGWGHRAAEEVEVAVYAHVRLYFCR